jgi:hypothetical protein
MWSTPEGDRVVQGYEASLIRETVGMMIDELDILADQTSFPPLEFGIPVWDGLTWQQKLATLDLVLRHLLQPSLPPLPLISIYEAAVGAIYEKVKCEIEVELDFARTETESEFHDEDNSWRAMVLAAFNQPRYADDGSMSSDFVDDLDLEFYPADANEIRKDRWFNVVESLADRLLWDRDYEMEDVFADIEPDQAAAMKSYMGVSEGYYQHIAPDLRDDQVASVFERIKAITHRRVDDECDF